MLPRVVTSVSMVTQCFCADYIVSLTLLPLLLASMFPLFRGFMHMLAANLRVRGNLLAELLFQSLTVFGTRVPMQFPDFQILVLLNGSPLPLCRSATGL